MRKCFFCVATDRCPDMRLMLSLRTKKGLLKTLSLYSCDRDVPPYKDHRPVMRSPNAVRSGACSASGSSGDCVASAGLEGVDSWSGSCAREGSAATSSSAAKATRRSWVNGFIFRSLMRQLRDNDGVTRVQVKVLLGVAIERGLVIEGHARGGAVSITAKYIDLLQLGKILGTARQGQAYQNRHRFLQRIGARLADFTHDGDLLAAHLHHHHRDVWVGEDGLQLLR